MVQPQELERFAFTFEGTEKLPHFDVDSYRIRNKIFLTHNKKETRACLKLNLIDQDVFCKSFDQIFYPVPNAWGKYGWTLVNLKKVKKSVFKDALNCAFCNVAPASLAKKYQSKDY